MKVEISKDGTLIVTAESIIEAFALNAIIKFGKDGKLDGSMLVIDCSILTRSV